MLQRTILVVSNTCSRTHLSHSDHGAVGAEGMDLNCAPMRDQQQMLNTNDQETKIGLRSAGCAFPNPQVKTPMGSAALTIHGFHRLFPYYNICACLFNIPASCLAVVVCSLPCQKSGNMKVCFVSCGCLPGPGRLRQLIVHTSSRKPKIKDISFSGGTQELETCLGCVQRNERGGGVTGGHARVQGWEIFCTSPCYWILAIIEYE